MQRRYFESAPISVDGTICLPLETDPKVLIEEAHHFIVFRSSYMKSSIRKQFMKALKQRKSEAKDKKCDVRAFENNSAVGVRGPAAETNVNNKNTNDRQRPDTECTTDSVYLETCLRSEIDPMFLVEASSKAFISCSESSISFPSSIYYWNRSSGKYYHHPHSNDHQIIESIFSDGKGIHFYRVENIDSCFHMKQFKYLLLSIRPSKDNGQNMEHQFSKE
jgi:hypothetical protein